MFQYARGNLKMRFRRLPLGLPCVPDLNVTEDDEETETDVVNVKRNVKKLRYFGNFFKYIYSFTKNIFIKPRIDLKVT